MKLIILAADLNFAIGNSANENDLPWENIPEDFKHFREITKLYKYVVMGKTTWETIFKKLGKPLPGRENIILSTTMTEPPHPEVKVFSLVDDILDYLTHKDFCIIGGAKTYEAFAPYADIIAMTKIHATHQADCWIRKEMITDSFYEDGAQQKTLREKTEAAPLVTVHFYKRKPAA